MIMTPKNSTQKKDTKSVQNLPKLTFPQSPNHFVSRRFNPTGKQKVTDLIALSVLSPNQEIKLSRNHIKPAFKKSFIEYNFLHNTCQDSKFQINQLSFNLSGQKNNLVTENGDKMKKTNEQNN
jgi:hypothetical protein